MLPSLVPILEREGPYQGEGFEPNASKTLQYLANECRVLVIGAGGLGCEILKDLALSGFRHIEVIDMDTIDYSNLNRQFLFRKHDVGKPKAEVAAAFVRARVPGVNIVAHYGNIKDKDEAFYQTFNIIICGLDSIDARRWMSSTLVGMVREDEAGEIDPISIIPMVDGGTEGWKGQARVVIPKISACFECTLDLFPPQVRYPMCTLATQPRLPEHCIEYAKLVLWEEQRPGLKFDADNAEHMQWMFDKATQRAKEFNIPGVTYRLTQGVTKNIIPAIASTNAIISAACVIEAFKIATNCANSLNNYWMYNGNTLYSYSFEYERSPACPVCGTDERTLTLDPQSTLEDFLQLLLENTYFQLKKPSIRCQSRSLYMQAPQALREATAPNLPKPMRELVEDGDVLDIVDPNLPGVAINVKILWKTA